MKVLAWAMAVAAVVVGACSEPADAQSAAPASIPQAGQRGDGAPYELRGTQVWDVPDPASGRQYQVFVQLPPSYEQNSHRLYPVIYATDADYAFPILRQIVRRVNLHAPVIEDFILVGLSYAVGDTGVVSRNRDYTPTANGPSSARTMLHGQGTAYQTYLKTHVLPFVEARFRADPARRVLLGHSYGGLLGAQVLFTEPTLFQAYVLGSPSFWFDQRHMMGVEQAYARTHRDLPAEVYMYIGEYEGPGPGSRYTTGPDMVTDMQAMERALNAHNYPGLTLTSVVLEGEDHRTVAPTGFTRALMAVLPAPVAP